ncbi:MAG: hypothetical protein EXR72_10395 [Myxococcales bacterium]|nr:hypothetical protein [Myxococcales bacterium]
MKNNLLACVVVLSLSGIANAEAPAVAKPAEKPVAVAAGAPAAPAGIQTMNCAEMAKATLPLPAKFVELMTAVSEGMTAHAAWVGAGKDKASKDEAASFKKLAADQKAVAAATKKVVTDMEAATKLAPAPHDMTKADPKGGERALATAKLEREMAALMIKHAEDTEKMVAAMGPKK